MSLLEFYATGSIKSLAKKMSRVNDMLYYLDNRLNTAAAPNENYAREFLELFTILKAHKMDLVVTQTIQMMMCIKQQEF